MLPTEEKKYGPQDVGPDGCGEQEGERNARGNAFESEA